MGGQEQDLQKLEADIKAQLMAVAKSLLKQNQIILAKRSLDRAHKKKGIQQIQQRIIKHEISINEIQLVLVEHYGLPFATEANAYCEGLNKQAREMHAVLKNDIIVSNPSANPVANIGAMVAVPVGLLGLVSGTALKEYISPVTASAIGLVVIVAAVSKDILKSVFSNAGNQINKGKTNVANDDNNAPVTVRAVRDRVNYLMALRC